MTVPLAASKCSQTVELAINVRNHCVCPSSHVNVGSCHVSVDKRVTAVGIWRYWPLQENIDIKTTVYCRTHVSHIHTMHSHLGHFIHSHKKMCCNFCSDIFICSKAHPSQASRFSWSSQCRTSDWEIFFQFLYGSSNLLGRRRGTLPWIQRQCSQEDTGMIPLCRTCFQASWRELQSQTFQCYEGHLWGRN